MKVVFIHTDFRIYWPARLETLYKFLEDKGIDLQVIEIAGAGSPYSFAVSNGTRPYYWHCLFPDMRMEEINSKRANYYLCNKLDEIRPDIVFCGAIAFPSGAAGVKWSVKNKKKCVVFDNARLQDVPRRWYINYLKKKIYSGSDAIFCPAPSWNKTFNYFGFTTDMIFYGLNAVDNSFWSDNKHPGNELNYNFFITAGRQIPKKNFRFLLESYRLYCADKTNPLHLVFVGDGPDHEILVSKMSDYDIKDKIHFYQYLSQDKLRTLFHRANWFILPSKFGETWGNVVNEAMASGLPVLVSDLAGCASTLVKEGVNGFTFSPDDVNGLAKLLSKVASMSKEERKMMGRKSLEIISEWGLERFCSGVYEAIKYVSGNNKKTTDLLGKIIISLWQGRYRPV